MILPNKFIRYKDSILPKTKVLILPSGSELTVLELYQKHKNHFADAAEYIYALDMLFALNIIDFDQKLGTIKYVD
ncbi:ABC-three component system middle component 7 [Maridesulfovibrio zosterae]|uniref:ABC-three component system middle component 7 n=1 Tax=Maridesulfovibrio zosterae TaxID=82171 RepID=UPI00048A0727